MTTIEIKKSFHTLIDSIDNNNLLINFYDLMKRRISVKDGQLWSRLNEKEQTELLNALEESQNEENLITQDVVKKKHKKWL